MKFVTHILAMFLVLSVVTCDLLAQTSSSAKQTVTFGVRRSAPVVVASAQSSTLSIKDNGVARSSPLRVSVGSTLQSEALADLGSPDHTVFAQATDVSEKSNLSLRRSSKTLPTSTDQLVVTLTE
jgi:hypothetical protein